MTAAERAGLRLCKASMGPASENAGYAARKSAAPPHAAGLQWVQRPRTPVMAKLEATVARLETASMGPASENAGYGSKQNSAGLFSRASMGPASENAGYGNPRRADCPERASFNGSSVRERRLCRRTARAAVTAARLQWVQRPRTPVMIGNVADGSPQAVASMGPASENAGYVRVPCPCRSFPLRFNGSSVRERRLCNTIRLPLHMSFDASMGPASENAGYDGDLGWCPLVLPASMGPASENAGYVPNLHHLVHNHRLQWVQRPRTPVMAGSGTSLAKRLR